MNVRGRGILFAFFLLLCSAVILCQTKRDPSVRPVAKTPHPYTMFAPYIYLGQPENNLPEIMAASGTKFFTLAFIQSGPSCTPIWYQGSSVVDDTLFKSYIDKIRAVGGDVIISFGGYDGTELGQSCSDVHSLQGAYQAVIDKYKVHILDLDIEHLAIKDAESVDRRNQALKALVAANPGLQINYTLPVTPTGMPDDAVNVLKSAAKYGTPVTIVNLMTMDYGEPVPLGGMGKIAISAVQSAQQQTKAIGINVRFGITPMIGINDTTTETFALEDTNTVLAYAKANRKLIGLLSFWSVARDNGSCPGTVKPSCSGIAQKDWEFSHIFQQF